MILQNGSLSYENTPERTWGNWWDCLFFTLGTALFGGRFVVDIDRMRAAGIGSGVIGIIIMLVTGLAQTNTKKRIHNCNFYLKIGKYSSA